MRQEPLQPHEIRTLRRTLGLTQKQFGAFFNRDAATIFRWEDGKYDPDPAAAAALVNLWNDVARQQQQAQQAQREADNLKSFAAGLIAGGVFAYLLNKSQNGPDDKGEDE